MRKFDIAQGQVLHRQGDIVNTLEIILKGSISIKRDEAVSVQAVSGAIIGAFDRAGRHYAYEYTASEDSTLFIYDYQGEADLLELVKANPSIAPVMASSSIAMLEGFFEALAAVHERGCALCARLKSDYEAYRDICAKLMIPPEKFENITALKEPPRPEILGGWRAELCRSFYEQDEQLRKEYYPLGSSFCVGSVMMAAYMGQMLQPQMEQALSFIRETRAGAAAFVKAYHTQKAKLDEAKRKEAMGASGHIPSITHALETILAFAEPSADIADAFRRDIRKFIAAPDRLDRGDDMRRLRRELANNFYAIYEAAFFKSLNTEEVPAEVKMFFRFGFVDEELAGAENTAALYKCMLLWEEDPEGLILPVYDWLCKIYSGEAQPSKNEFDNDWSEYLREQVRSAAITQKQADAMLDDRQAMVRYEIQTLFASANKMTYGSIFTFVPVFHAGMAVRPLEECLASPARVRAALDKVREMDFGCFYRQTVTSYPELKMNRFEYNVEVLPYIILMPNFGSRGHMWQEIEGRKRTTPAHMVLSILHSEKLDATLLRMCAQFRWEMCKRVQGVHYSDISDPSLTAEYINYLQFYKKNHDLSADMKEKVKQTLQRKNNNYRDVFIGDYETFLKFESEGLPRLNKVARDILFRYCTFSRRYREALSANPQYQQLIARWTKQQDTKMQSYEFLTRKILKLVEKLPKEVEREAEFMRL